ncbi:MAG: putative lipid II flippase FtsW [Candidatus Omnitrophica bacterium]|nr:putative lipid II flippase FtsW [Candidatus Omnitrophota bacterium]
MHSLRALRQRLAVITAMLVAAGIVMIYSASAIQAQEVYHNRWYFLERHVAYAALGVLLSGLVLAMDCQWLRRHLRWLLLISGVLLIAVLVPGLGYEVSGARRWFRLGFLSFQPSELAQVVVILYLADVLARKQDRLRSFIHGFLPPMLILGTFVGLMLLQPDLGTSVALASVVFLMLFVSGIEMIHLGPALASAIPVLGILIASKPYRVRRILAFANPWADPQGAGFQLIQSLVAIGTGGIWGVGLGQSRQKLFYLPAAHTDFIFSIIAEELGLLGATAILALFLAFVWIGVRIALRATDLFAQLACLGLAGLVGLKALIHMAVATGMVPTKGLPLPFVSFGGTSLIFNLMIVALLLNMGRGRATAPANILPPGELAPVPLRMLGSPPVPEPV